jgi:integrase
MPKVAKELSAIEVKRLVAPGHHPVGGVSGLYLRVNDADGKSWILRTMVGAKRRDIGLGGYPSVTLADARERARRNKEEIASGIDPVVERKNARAALIAKQRKGRTFQWAVEEFLNSGTLDGLRNAKHRAQWRSTLETYALPKLGTMCLDEIVAKDLHAVLEPIWLNKHETASRLRGRIEKVLDWAAVMSHRSGENPARWKGNLSELLPKVRKDLVSDNQPALPISTVPAWYSQLKRQNGLAAKALCFLTLTAARSGEIRGALWSEMDLENSMWTVPAKRMKAGREHRVPLSRAALDILRSLPRYPGSQHVFPSPKGTAMSDMTVSAVMRRMNEAEVAAKRRGWLDLRNGRPAVPHGLRSTFRDWVAELTGYPRELAEIALAHRIGNEVERAYHRSDMIEKRRQMLEDWADFVTSSISIASAADNSR